MTLWGLLWAVLSLGICAYGFSQSQFKLTEESITSLSEKVETAKLQPLIEVVYDSDLAFKDAFKQSLGESAAKTHEAQLIQAAGDMPATLILFGILSFICAFNFSVGPVIWVLFSEIFPIQIRGIAIPFFALLTSIVSYFVQQFFPWQLAIMGVRDIFIFYGVLSTIGLVALISFLPETKNKTIEEIEAALMQSEVPNLV